MVDKRRRPENSAEMGAYKKPFLRVTNSILLIAKFFLLLVKKFLMTFRIVAISEISTENH